MTQAEMVLPPDLARRLRDRAADEGITAERYLERLLEEEVGKGDALQRAKERFRNRTPEEIAAAREDALRSGHQALPLPEGKTLFDVIEGTWPGDETDEEILVILEQLS